MRIIPQIVLIVSNSANQSIVIAISFPTKLSNIPDERDQHRKDNDDPNSDKQHLLGSQPSSFIARYFFLLLFLLFCHILLR